LRTTPFDESLLAVVGSRSNPAGVRVEAMAAVAPQLSSVDEPLFEFLLGCLEKEHPALMRMTAADALNRSPLNKSQLITLTGRILTAEPIEISRLLGAFDREHDGETGKTLLAALEK